jgi:hypothetical protein
MEGFIPVKVTVLAGTLFMESIRSRAQDDEENRPSVTHLCLVTVSCRTRISALYDEVLLLRRCGLNCVLN